MTRLFSSISSLANGERFLPTESEPSVAIGRQARNDGVEAAREWEERSRKPFQKVSSELRIIFGTEAKSA